ncbi:MAG: hypothetical protein GY757_57745, partial [bacterium]|nr:hypothetical protein [bacterium]
FKRFAGNKKDRLEIVISDSGSYIIEVYVPDNTFSELPWILSNPFFIGNRSVPTGLDAKNNTGVVLKKYLAAEKGFFHVEKNTASMGKLSYMTDKNLEKNNPEGSKLEHRDTEVAELVSILDFNLTKSPGEKDFWAALASRKRFDFSDATGFIFEVRSDSKRRVWLEFRTGEKKGNEKGQEKVGNESWYRHSFLVDDEWSCIHIPFNKFYLFFGENKPPVLSDIHSLFFSINNSNAYAGSAGTFRLRNFGIY